MAPMGGVALVPGVALMAFVPGVAAIADVLMDFLARLPPLDIALVVVVTHNKDDTPGGYSHKTLRLPSVARFSLDGPSRTQTAPHPRR